MADISTDAMHVILIQISRVNSEEHGTKVDTVRLNQVNFVEQDNTKFGSVRFQVYFSWVLSPVYIFDLLFLNVLQVSTKS